MLNETKTLSANLSNLTSFIDQNILTKTMAIEVIIIAAAFFLGWIISRLLFSRAEKTLQKEKHKKLTNKFSKYHNQIREISAVLWPLITGTILWSVFKTLPSSKIRRKGMPAR